MSAAPKAFTPPRADLDEAADQAIAAWSGDAREAVKALLAANDFLEKEIEQLRASVSTCYSRGRFEVQCDRKE
jgi:hypothetical protein